MIVQIVAKAAGIDVELEVVIPRQGLNKREYAERFPLSRGKIPGLESPKIRLTEILSIVVYLVKSSSKASGLLGDGSVESECEVLKWMNWANQELIQALARWFLPLIPSFTDPAPYNFEAVAAGKEESLQMLETLECILENREYLVGNQLTLADIMVTIFIARGMEWVLDAAWRARHTAIMEHFKRITLTSLVADVVPHFVPIDYETPNRPPMGDLITPGQV